MRDPGAPSSVACRREGTLQAITPAPWGTVKEGTVQSQRLSHWASQHRYGSNTSLFDEASPLPQQGLTGLLVGVQWTW